MNANGLVLLLSAFLPVFQATTALAQAPSGAAAESPATGQLVLDARWSPFLGCWQLVEERSRHEHVATRACFERAPAGDGVQLTTFHSDQSRTVRDLTADGRARGVQVSGCQGNERVEWSASGTRFYRNGEHSCQHDVTPRMVSGISLLPNAATLVDIEVMNGAVQVRRFFREGDRQAESSMVTSPFTIDDVREASTKVAARAVEAAIIESHARFSLNAQTLVSLDDAGVADSVIDLMVAVTYPNRFVVDRPGVPPGRISGGGAGGVGLPWFGLSPEYLSPYDPYGSWTFFGGGGFFFDPGQQVNAPSGGGTPSTDGRGVAVNGLGYTRVRTTSEVSSSRSSLNNSSTVSGHAVARRSNVAVDSGSGGGDASQSSSSSGSSGEVSSSGGYSSGGGDSGRTAEPR